MTKTTTGLDKAMSPRDTISFLLGFLLMLVIIGYGEFWLTTGIALGAQLVEETRAFEASFSYGASILIIITAVLLIPFLGSAQYLITDKPAKWFKARSFGQMVGMVIFVYVTMWCIPPSLGFFLLLRNRQGFGLF